jgi:2-amino-4-hydroxy-6-hydroxymethyldihydropteridine diphosphokinase
MKPAPVRIFLALGTNVGDRMLYLAEARRLLEEHPEIRIAKTSGIYETEPWPKVQEDQELNKDEESGSQWYLNQVVSAATTLSPQQLLEAVKGIEKSLGRTPTEKWGPREIDIDILLYGEEIFDAPELEIPHRHMNDRLFVLVPLLEIEPDLKDPRSGHPFRYFRDHLGDDHTVISFP